MPHHPFLHSHLNQNHQALAESLVRICISFLIESNVSEQLTNGLSNLLNGSRAIDNGSQTSKEQNHLLTEAQIEDLVQILMNQSHVHRDSTWTALQSLILQVFFRASERSQRSAS